MSDHTSLEELFARGVEGAVEEGEECYGILGEDLLVGVCDIAGDGNSLEDGVGGSHLVLYVPNFFFVSGMCM